MASTSTDDDPLLSIAQVARLYGTGIGTVVDLVSRGRLCTLDGGRLAQRGRLDVPVVRKSWATAIQHDSPGASRRINSNDLVHPAVGTALDFHTAVDDSNAPDVFLLSSRESREGMSAEDLLEAWRGELAAVLAEPSGVGTAIYSLAPLPAVAARVFANPPSIPRVFDRATPATLLAALPLVYEGGDWKVDLPLFRSRHDWMHLLSEPLPHEEPSTEGT